MLFFMQNMIQTHQLEHGFSNFSGSKITHSKSVARCVAINAYNQYFFIINNCTFLRGDPGLENFFCIVDKHKLVIPF